MKELVPISPAARQLCRIFNFDNSYVIVAKKSDLAQLLEVGGDEAAICVPKEILAADLEPSQEPK
jgi:hypothetical protein